MVLLRKGRLRGCHCLFPAGPRNQAEGRIPRRHCRDPVQLGGNLFSYWLYSQGVDYYLKALDLWRKAGDKRGVAFASYGLSKAFQNQGRYGAALTSAEDALRGWREINEPSFWLAEIQGNYGNALALIGRGDEAAKNLEEALGKARELKNNTTIAHIL